jgi:hypothetical protein
MLFGSAAGEAVFSMLEVEKVGGAVIVVSICGIGRKVTATAYALVGNWRLTVFAVIAVPGSFAIGAYLVTPVNCS